ncbi:hypothetical protein [Persicobacter diffluens]|uniref:Uncharacterized protein n=1 Tax=Persicobacter diffluens TaxID=981 RepID=A0AAN4VUC7_9BACT|nr:hypothetical protein PEDI_04400 [Persicobacter diffluens]
MSELDNRKDWEKDLISGLKSTPRLSSDFSQRVLHKMQHPAIVVPMKHYSPLISKRIWVLLLVLVVALGLAVLMMAPAQSVSTAADSFWMNWALEMSALYQSQDIIMGAFLLALSGLVLSLMDQQFKKIFRSMSI